MRLSDIHCEEVRQAYLFEHLGEAAFAELTRHARLLVLTGGDMLFADGDPCRHFYLLRSGMIKLFKSSAEGSERVVELIRPGQLFGEEAMFAEAYSAHADALEASEVFAFEANFFAGQMRDDTELCLRMMALMSRRSRKLVDEIGNMTLQNAIQRAVRYLMQMGGRGDGTIQLNFPRGILASRLGVTPETFSRIMTKLRNEGMIDSRRDSIVLKNVDSLRLVADGMIGLKL